MRPLSVLAARTLALSALTALALLAAPERAHAIGFLVPTDGSLEPLRIQHHRVSVDVRERIAETRVEQSFLNQTDRTLEATYIFPVPEGATVSGFAMWVNGQRMEGELLDAGQARSVYESIVARMRDPGLVEHIGGNLFRARVFPIAPHSEQRIEIRFSQTLEYQGSVVHYRYPLRTSGPATQTLADFTVSFDIASRTAIRAVYSPTHNLSVSRENDHHVIASYEGSRASLDHDLDLYYTVDDGDVGLSLLTHRPPGEDGYFLAMVAPRTELTDQELASKEVLFVFDTSGSMAGDKITRARAALDYMLQRLRPTDRFQVIRFSTDVEVLFDRGSSEPATPENVARARYFASHFVAAGGTAIEPALREALRTNGASAASPRMIVFLTDGMPTVGTTDPGSIVRSVSAAALQSAPGGARLFAFGVGDDVNTTFLDALARSAQGHGEYFRDGSEMERRLSSFYDHIAYPAVTNVRLTFPGANAYDVYPRELHELYRGEQVLVVGRYRGEGPARVVLEGHVGAEASNRSFAFDVSFPALELRNDFVPRVWAVRKVGGLLEEIRLNGERPELREEVTSLARRFGLVTPYTSYLVAPDQTAPVAPPTTIELQGRVQFQFEDQQIEGDLVRPEGRVARPAAEPAPAEAERFAGFDTTLAAPTASGGGMGGGSAASSTGSAPTHDSRPASMAPSGATGERGRRISDELRQMETAERPDDATSRGTRYALGRAFRYESGGFVDPQYRTSMRTIHIRALSRAYFAILARRPDLRAAFAIGDRVTIAIDETRAIVIEPTAPDVAEADATHFLE
ncbi:MAG: VIT and VWA domain-containing protein [Sandaracinaceae bacterium]|nr:VIT and VWA domain-containing protein [Sandaracinaceae bacterium]